MRRLPGRLPWSGRDIGDRAGLIPVLARREIGGLLFSDRARQSVFTSLVAVILLALFLPIFRAYGHPRLREGVASFPVFAIALQVLVFLGALRAVWAGMRRDAAAGSVDELMLTGARVTLLLTARWLGVTAVMAVWVLMALPFLILTGAVTGAEPARVALALVALLATCAAGALTGALVSISERGMQGSFPIVGMFFQFYFLMRLFMPRLAGSLGPWGAEILLWVQRADPVTLMPAALGITQESWGFKLLILALLVLAGGTWLAGADQDFPALTRPPLPQERNRLTLLSLRPFREWVSRPRTGETGILDRDVIFRFEWVHGWRTRIGPPFWLSLIALALVPALVAVIAGAETNGRERWLLLVEPCLAALFSALGMAASLSSEREQGRWVFLLTSPLRDFEILSAKWRAATLETWPFWPTALLRAVLLAGFGSLSWTGALLAFLAVPVAAGTAAAVAGALCIGAASLAAAQQRALLFLTLPSLAALTGLWLLPGMPGLDAVSLPILLVRGLAPGAPDAAALRALALLAGWAGFGAGCLWLARWQLRRWPPLLGLALVAGLQSAAFAAPPVTVQPAAARGIEEYDAAARDAGMAEWGVAYDAGRATHFCLRLGNRSTLSVFLPPDGDTAGQDRWIQDLVDRLGWTRVGLFRSSLPTTTVMRVETRDVVRTTNAGDWAAEFNLAALETAAPSGRPAYLGVRTDLAGMPQRTPPPAFQIVRGRWQYAFYRLPTGSPSFQAVYRVPPRWRAAAWISLLLWMLFLPTALWIVRNRLRGLDVTPPGVPPPRPGTDLAGAEWTEWKEARESHRFALYNWWCGGVSGVALIGVVLCAFVLGIPRFFTTVAFGRPEAYQLIFIGGFFLPRLIQRLLGLPLERSAFPVRARMPWYRIAGLEIGVLVGLGLMFGLLGAARAGALSGLGGWLPRGGVSHVVVLPVLFASVAGLVAAAWYWERFKWRRRRTGPWKGEDELPAEAEAALLALSEPMGCPVRRAYVPRKAGYPSGVQVYEDLALVNRDCLEQLSPEELSALVAAEALFFRESRRDWYDRYGAWITMLPMLVCAGTIIWGASGGTRPPGWAMTLFAISMPLLVITSMISTRRTLRRRVEVDLQVADAASSPRVMIRALDRLNRLGLSPVASSPRHQHLQPNALRLQRLKDRLGLD